MTAIPAAELLTIASTDLTVGLTPARGGTIASFVDRATGIDVLFRTPWGWREPSAVAAGDTRQQWLGRYVGGWQQLVPNAGPATVRGGVEQGYHGEAAIVPWQVVEHDRTSASLGVDLLTAPLSLTRTVVVDGPVLRVRDTVANRSRVATTACWVEHPAFGAPFVDGATRVQTNARTVVTDADDPGALAGDRVATWPTVPGSDGAPIDLRQVPGPDRRSVAFAALTDFDAPAWYAIVSPRAGFGIAVAWDPTALPHAWWWQECHGTPGYPWFGEAYVIAIEPANVLPGTGQVDGRPRSDAPVLAPGGQWTSELVVIRLGGTDDVTAVALDGTVQRAPDTGTDRR